MKKLTLGPEAFENDLSFAGRDGDFLERYSPEYRAAREEQIKAMEELIRGHETKPEPKRAKDFNPYHEPGGSPEGGRFARAGAGGGGGGEPETGTRIPEGHAKRMLARAREVATKQGYPAEMIKMGAEKAPDREFELNGKKYMAAGLAHITDSPGAPPKGTIRIFPTALSEDTVEGVTVHEIMHQKWQTVFDAYKSEKKAMHKLADPHSYKDNPVMNIDDTLKPPYDKQFPIYTKLHEFIDGATWEKLRKFDGITSYSTQWWGAAEARDAGMNQAVHETLAEMARIEAEFPEGFNDVRGSSWDRFYKAVKEIYKELPK